MRIIFSHSSSAAPSLYTAADIRQLEQAAAINGLTGITLMKRAGRAAFALLLERFPSPEHITVYCGGGNNAGDGYVVAALAAQRCIPVQVVHLVPPQQLGNEALQAYEFALQEGVTMVPFSEEVAPPTGVIVDALLGIGMRSAPKEAFAAAIEHINRCRLPVLALDLPSGLLADTGATAGAVIRATLTITFIGLKRGLVSGRGPEVCGDLHLADLDLATLDLADSRADGTLPECLLLDDVLHYLAPRKADAHKGDFGHVMVIGGDTGFGGAALMAAEAAARTGAGLVSVATRPEHIAAILARRPEIIACGVVSGQELEPWLARPTVLVLGPGLGNSPWSEQMLQQAANTQLPMVLDADALNMVAAERVLPVGTKRDNWLLTPHPGEAARLLGISTAEVQADRFAAVKALHQRYGGAVILKGAGSLVAGSHLGIGVVTDGNPGMASGGMGDILSGILGGLIAQGLSIEEAARLGATLHSAAADLAADEIGQRGLLAMDLLPYLCQLLSE